jgi:hypothetical protein
MAVNYQLKLGDCIFCIIEKHGLIAETVWEHANNAVLRRKRSELKMLLPGDVLFIPDIRLKEVKRPTNQFHKFQIRGEPHRHWIEIEMIGEDDKPVPHEKYKVALPDGSVKEGVLDENGWARVESDPTGDCEIIFPEIDREAWKYLEAIGPKTQNP